MTNEKNRSTWAGLLAATLMLPLMALAENGTFQFIGSTYADITSLQMGDTVFAVAAGAGTFTILKSSSKPLDEGTSAPIKWARYSRKSPSAFELEANCIAAVAQDDSIFLTFKRKTGDIVAGTGGVGTLSLAGSGRYAKLTGQCQYQTQNYPDKWNITRGTCEWKM